MESISDTSIVPLNRKRQPLGILPTYSFWFGKTKAYHAVSPWFLFICGLIPLVGAYALLRILGLDSFLANQIAMPTSVVLTLGILEKVVRKKIAHRAQKRLAAEESIPSKQQLPP